MATVTRLSFVVVKKFPVSVFLLLLSVLVGNSKSEVEDSSRSLEKEYTIQHNTIYTPEHAKFMEKYSSLLESPPVAEIFLTKGDTEETVSLNPDDSGDIVITEDMLHNGTQYNHVVLACNSSYPVEWVYEGGDGVSCRNYIRQ